MREKNHVEKLSLGWSESIADNSQTERDILDKLHPHENIKELQITGYRGTKFPNWVADPLFLKLVELSIHNCKNCDSLPALGQLPSLKYLSIRRMDGIAEVTEEFYGSSSSRKPFNSLENLVFEDMPEWKQWHALDFPKLEKLSIINCAKLMRKLPENLCSLKELKISRCPELSLETAIQLSSLKKFEAIGSPKVFDEAQLFMKQIEELCIYDCNSLTSLPFSIEGMTQIEVLYLHDCNSLTSIPFGILPSTLKRVRICGCQKLKLEGTVGEMFLEELTLEYCDSIDDISPELLPTARSLWVRSCASLTRFLIPPATETLYIWRCENVEKLSVACGNLPSAMTYLWIHECLNLKWLPERIQELLPSLKKLYLTNCPEIESFPEGGLPVNLQALCIGNCTKLVNGQKEWRLQRLSCLRELVISHDGSDEDIEHWELPSSIQILKIGNLKTLSSQLLKSLTSLEYLRIESHAELHLPGLCHLTSLQTLHIWDCHNLQSLSESALPSSFSKLYIRDCPNLQSLPVNGMPSSLSKLHISDCPLLTPLLEFDKGEYWPNIAQIPNIEIDSEPL